MMAMGFQTAAILLAVSAGGGAAPNASTKCVMLPPESAWPSALYVDEVLDLTVECSPGIDLAVPSSSGYNVEPPMLRPPVGAEGATAYKLFVRAEQPSSEQSRLSIIAGDGRSWPAVTLLPPVLAAGMVNVSTEPPGGQLYEDESLSLVFTLSHQPREMLILTPRLLSGEHATFRPKTLAFTPQSGLQGTITVDGLGLGNSTLTFERDGTDAPHFGLEAAVARSGLTVRVLELESFALSPAWRPELYVGEEASYTVSISRAAEQPITLSPFFANATFSPSSIHFGGSANSSLALRATSAHFSVIGSRAGNGSVVFYVSGAGLLHYAPPLPLPLTIWPQLAMAFEPARIVAWPGDSVVVHLLTDGGSTRHAVGKVEVRLEATAGGADGSGGGGVTGGESSLWLSPSSLACSARPSDVTEGCAASFTVDVPDGIASGAQASIGASLAGAGAAAYALPAALQVEVLPKLPLAAALQPAGAGGEAGGEGEPWYVGQTRILVVRAPSPAAWVLSSGAELPEVHFGVAVATRGPHGERQKEADAAPGSDAADATAAGSGEDGADGAGALAQFAVSPAEATLLQLVPPQPGAANGSRAEFRLTALSPGSALIHARPTSMGAHRASSEPIEVRVLPMPTFSLSWPTEAAYVQEAVQLLLAPTVAPSRAVRLRLHAHYVFSPRNAGAEPQDGLHFEPSELVFPAGSTQAQALVVRGASPGEFTVWSSLAAADESGADGGDGGGGGGAVGWMAPPANGTFIVIERGTFSVSPAVLGPIYEGSEVELHIDIAHSPLRSLNENQRVTLRLSAGAAAGDAEGSGIEPTEPLGAVDLSPTELSWAPGEQHATPIRVRALAAGTVSVRFELASASDHVAFVPPQSVPIRVRSRETVSVTPWEADARGVLELAEYKGVVHVNVTISRPPLYSVVVRPLNLPAGLELEPPAARFDPCEPRAPANDGGACSPTTVPLQLRASSALGTVSIGWSVALDDHRVASTRFASPPNTTVVVSPVALVEAARVEEGNSSSLLYAGDSAHVDVWPRTAPADWRGDLVVTARAQGDGCTAAQAPDARLVFSRAHLGAQRVSFTSASACALAVGFELSGPGASLFAMQAQSEQFLLEFAPAEELVVSPSTTVAYVGDTVQVNVSVPRVVPGESLELALGCSADVGIEPASVTLSAAQRNAAFTLHTEGAQPGTPLRLSLTGRGSALAHVRVPSGDVAHVQLISLETFSVLATYPDLYVGDLAALRISVTKHLDQDVTIRPTGRGLLFSPPIISFRAGEEHSHSFAVQGTVTGEIPISYEIGGANAAHFIEPVESRIRIKEPEVFLVSGALSAPDARYVGDVATLAVRVSAPPYTLISLTPSASCVSFAPAQLDFTPAATELELLANYSRAGNCSVHWKTAGPNLLHFTAPPSQPVVVRPLERLELPGTLRLYAGGQATLRVQAPAACAEPDALCSIASVTPRAPGFSFVPATAPLAMPRGTDAAEPRAGAPSALFEVHAEGAPLGGEEEAVSVAVELAGEHSAHFEAPRPIALLHTPLERFSQALLGGVPSAPSADAAPAPLGESAPPPADDRRYYVGEQIELRLSASEGALARAAAGVPAEAGALAVVVAAEGPDLQIEPAALTFDLSAPEEQGLVVVCYSAGLSSVSFRLAGALADHFAPPPPLVLRLRKRSSAFFATLAPPDGAPAPALPTSAHPLALGQLYELEAADFAVALGEAPLRNLTLEPRGDGLRFEPRSVRFGPEAATLSATFRVVALSGARHTAISLACGGVDAPFYDAPPAAPLTILPLKRIEVAADLGRQYVREETSHIIRLPEAPIGELALNVSADEPCVATPALLVFSERATAASVRLSSEQPAECALHLAIDLAVSDDDARHFAAPPPSALVVMAYERFRLSAAEQELTSLQSRPLSFELSHAPRSALTVRPLADGLSFEPPTVELGPEGESNATACTFEVVGRTPGTFVVRFALEGEGAAHVAPPASVQVTVRPMAIRTPPFAGLIAGVPSAAYTARIPEAGIGANVTMVLNGSALLRAQPAALRFGADGLSQPFTLTGLTSGSVALAYALVGADAELFEPPPPVRIACVVVAASKLRLLGVPKSIVAGRPFNVLVDVLNPDGHRHIDLSGESSITVSLIVMTYDDEIFEGVSTSSIEEVEGVANMTIVLTKAVPIRLVASAPGLAADSSARIPVVADSLSPNATSISCGHRHVLAGQTVSCAISFRDAYGNEATPPSDVQVHIVEPGGRLIDVRMLHAEPAQTAEPAANGTLPLSSAGAEPAAPLNFTFMTAHTGVAMILVDWAASVDGVDGADGDAPRETYAQPISIFAGMLVPSMTDFSCAPNPIRAGEVAQCTIVTRGPFSNRAAGAVRSDFEVLVGPGFSYSSNVHANGADEFGFVAYAEGAQESSISVRFRTERLGQKSLLFQQPLTITPGAAAMDLSTLTCTPNPVMQGERATCELIAQDHFGNVASLDVPPPAEGEAADTSDIARLLRSIDVHVVDSSGQLLSSSAVSVSDERSRFTFSFTAGRIGPTEVRFANGGRAAVGSVLVTPPHNAFLPSSPYRFEGGSQSARDQTLLILAFAFLTLASKHIAKMIAKLGVPLVTGYLAVGIIVGPHGLMLLPYNGPSHLGFVGKLALGFIGFTAGSKFYLNELKEYFRKVLLIMFSLITFTYTFVFLAVTFFGDVIPYMGGMTQSQRLAIALLFACLSVARSPSSSIAIISELNAAGPFTTIMLAVVVMMDVFVVVLFSLTSLAVIALDKAGREGEDGGGEDAKTSDVLIIFALQMVVSVIGGFVVANVLVLTMVRLPNWQFPEGSSARFGPLATLRLNGCTRLLATAWRYLQRAIFLAIGYSVFVLEILSSERFGFAIMQPMIVCMIVRAHAPCVRARDQRFKTCARCAWQM